MAGINRTTGKATDLITFSRASGGTALRKISYGSELITNGTFDTDLTGWTVGGGSPTVVGGQVEAVTTSQGFVISQTFSVTPGATYVFSGERGTPNGTFWGYNSQYIGVSKAFGAIEGSPLTFKATGSLFTVGYYSSFTGERNHTIDNISVKEVLFDQPDGTLTLFNHPTNIPRIEYAADGTVKGLLIEEARTNLMTYSEDFTQWSALTSGIISNSNTSPDGSINADKLFGTVGSTNIRRYKATSLSAGTTYTYSIFAKAGEYSDLRVQRYNTNLDIFTHTFDLTAGTSVGGSIQDFGNGWYRCSGQIVCNTSSTTGPLFSTGVGETGDGTSGIYIWGAQLEAGSFPTSYIGTSGSAATRAADIASISVDNFGYRQDAGTVVVEFEMISDTASTSSYSQALFCFHDGTSNNRFEVSSEGTGSLSLKDRVSSVNYTANVTGLSLDSNSKAAAAYKVAGVSSISASGSSVSSTASTDNNRYTEMIIGDTQNIDAEINGHIKSIAYYPRRLSNAQLQELTA